MDPKTFSGRPAAKKLDIVSDLSPWKNAVQRFMDGKEELQCPLCQNIGLEPTAFCGSDRIGFLLLTCPFCGKSANFSRIKFPSSVTTQNF